MNHLNFISYSHRIINVAINEIYIVHQLSDKFESRTIDKLKRIEIISNLFKNVLDYYQYRTVILNLVRFFFTEKNKLKLQLEEDNQTQITCW